MTHTPGPWLVRIFRGRHYVTDSIPDRDGKVVANTIAIPSTNLRWEEDAQLIVTAVNAHADLLAAAKAAYSLLGIQGPTTGPGYQVSLDLAAAIAKATQPPVVP